MVQMNVGGLTFGLPPDGILGEVKMFALTIAGAVTKAVLQGRGWAICDGTTAATQGITSPTITIETPDLQNKFIKGSDDETSGTTGGSTTYSHSVATATRGTTGPYDPPAVTSISNHTDIEPPFYELAFFIKVRV